MPSIPELLALAAALCLVAACIADLGRFEIPDWISVAILTLAIAFGVAVPEFEWGSHALAVLAMFAVGLLLFAIGWMGGGDVKLITATAGWTGLAGLPAFLIGMALAGGGLAIFLLAGRAGFRIAGIADERVPGPLRRGAPLPYAVAIAGGAAWWAWRAWPLA